MMVLSSVTLSLNAVLRIITLKGDTLHEKNVLAAE